jgi:bacterioferritin-associated ferredoxin
MYVCGCRGITEADVRRAGEAGAVTADKLITVLDLQHPLCCGRCVERIEQLVDLATESLRSDALVAST